VNNDGERAPSDVFQSSSTQIFPRPEELNWKLTVPWLLPESDPAWASTMSLPATDTCLFARKRLSGIDALVRTSAVPQHLPFCSPDPLKLSRIRAASVHWRGLLVMHLP